MKQLRIRHRRPEEIARDAASFGLKLSPAEWAQIGERLGRDLTIAEAFFFDVSWSEHCSYKSSRALLKEYLPPMSHEVLLGPGEDAGIVKLGRWRGQEWTLVVAHESHNHPSQVLPVEGAATGVGGIVRDVYCMGADVIGCLDSLRFGDPEGPNRDRVRGIVRGVVQGIAEYGDALGVPNLGGEVVFHPSFDDNCLVNVVAFGIAPEERIIRSRVPEAARQEPYALILVGKPTDATGLLGASFASQVLDEAEAAENRGAVQIHDPFLKRVLVEATKQVWAYVEAHGLAVGCKDLGAGGLAGASSELVFAGGFGAAIDLDRVPRGVSDLEPHEVLCGETQERFVWAVPREHAAAIAKIFNEDFELGRVYPNACAAIVGEVTAEPVYRCRAAGETVLELAASIVEESPRLHRPRQARPEQPAAADPKAPSDWRAWAAAELASYAAASRAPVFRYFDPEVQGRALLRPGEAGAGVCRPLPGEALGVAVSVDGNPTYGALDAYWGGALAVLEAVRNVVATGARPIALTDCMNFGSPEDPVCLGDFESSLKGMRDACHALARLSDPPAPLPFVSGNVSLYNYSSTGKAIAPSPIVACFGRLDDYSLAVSPRVKQAGDRLLLVGRRERAWGAPLGTSDAPRGRVPTPDLEEQAKQAQQILQLIGSKRLRACQDIADGGLLRAVWEMIALEDRTGPLGIDLDLAPALPGGPVHEQLLSEWPGFVLEVEPSQSEPVLLELREAGLFAVEIGAVTAESALRVRQGAAAVFELEVEAVRVAWAGRLESILYEGGKD